MKAGRNGRRWARVSVVMALTACASVESRGGEPSPAFRAELRRTAELRKQRRREPTRLAVGMIEAWPMPSALIVRQTRENHDEIGALLDILRYGGR